MQLTDTHTIKICPKQKQTLIILKRKYKINTSQFIRDAIFEKLERERKGIIEVEKYLNEQNQYPF